MWQRLRSASGGPAARLSILFDFSVNIKSNIDLASDAGIRKVGKSTCWNKFEFLTKSVKRASDFLEVVGNPS